MDMPASPGRCACSQVSPAPEAAAEKRNLPDGCWAVSTGQAGGSLVEQCGRQGVHIRAWWGLRFAARSQRAERGRLSLSMRQVWPRMQDQGCQP